MNQYFDFRAWFEDQMAAKGHDLGSLAERLDTTPRKVGRLINNSDEWTITEVRTVAEALDLNWWDEFLMPLRLKGLRTRITIDECDELLRTEGERLDRIAQVA